MNMKCSVLALAAGGLLGVAGAAPACGFFRKGDVWVLSGDSITHNDFYRQTVMAALDHFHPGNGIRAMNTAVWGQLTSEAKGQGVDLKPTVVTIMLGMNNVIHHDYPATYDFTFDAASYAETIRRQVKAFQAQGARVVLLKPTLTDETEFSYFAVANTRAGLVAYGRALEKIAAEESCDLLPLADDFELFKSRMPALATLIPDGVHPYGWGQYALARALVHHFHIELPLAESDAGRTVDTTLVTLSDFQVARERPFLEAGEKPAFRIVAPRDCRVRVRWSVADTDLRGDDVVEMRRGETAVYVPKAPEAALPHQLGTVTRLLLTLEPGWDEPRVAVADFARTRVHRMTDGRVSGKTGPAEWTMREDGPDLWLEGRVRISEWPARKPASSDHWMNSGGMNGVKIMWDFRPLDRFAEQRYDHDVNSTEFSVLENPWSVNSQAWINRRVQSCLMTDAKPTADGFAFTIGFRGRVNDYTRFDIRRHDVFGCYLIFDVCENGQIAYHPDFEQLYGPEKTRRINPEFRLNQTAVFDRKGVLKGDETVTMGVFGL